MPEQSGDAFVQKIRIRIDHDILSQTEIVQGDTARELHFSLKTMLRQRMLNIVSILENHLALKYINNVL